MPKFTYNNAKSVYTNHMLFKFSYICYPCISYEKDLDLYLKTKIV